MKVRKESLCLGRYGQFTMKTVILTRFVSHVTFNRCEIFARLIDNDNDCKSQSYTVLTP